MSEFSQYKYYIIQFKNEVKNDLLDRENAVNIMDQTSRKSSISLLSGTSSFLEGLQLRPIYSDEESVTNSENRSQLSESELSGTSSVLDRIRFYGSLESDEEIRSYHSNENIIQFLPLEDILQRATYKSENPERETPIRTHSRRRTRKFITERIKCYGRVCTRVRNLPIICIMIICIVLLLLAMVVWYMTTDESDPGLRKIIDELLSGMTNLFTLDHDSNRGYRRKG